MRKNASLHLFELDEAKKNEIIEHYKKISNVVPTINESLSNDILIKGTNRIYEFYNGVSFIEDESVLSIYDESIGFESIRIEAMEISQKFKSKVFYVSNFKNCVFLCGLIRNDKVLTELIIGNNLSEYGLKRKLFDIGIIINEIPSEVTSKTIENLINHIKVNNVTCVETEIGELLGISMYIDWD